MTRSDILMASEISWVTKSALGFSLFLYDFSQYHRLHSDGSDSRERKKVHPVAAERGPEQACGSERALWRHSSGKLGGSGPV